MSAGRKTGKLVNYYIHSAYDGYMKVNVKSFFTAYQVLNVYVFYHSSSQKLFNYLIFDLDRFLNDSYFQPMHCKSMGSEFPPFFLLILCAHLLC